MTANELDTTDTKSPKRGTAPHPRSSFRPKQELAESVYSIVLLSILYTHTRRTDMLELMKRRVSWSGKEDFAYH